MNNNRAYGSYDQFVLNGVEMFEKVVLSLLSSNNTAKTEIENHLHICMRN